MGTGLMAWACLMLAAGAPGDDVVPFGARGFKIPLTFDAAKRATIREVVLYCSKDAGRNWEIIGKTLPDKDHFEYVAQGDGLHYFSITVIDSKGFQDPPDIYKAPVGLKMFIDTVKPAVKLLAAERHGDEVQISWEARDERPDWATLKVEYKVGDSPAAGWTPLAVTSSERGNHRFRPALPGPVAVRVSLKDMAGNEAHDDRTVPAATQPMQDHSLTRISTDMATRHTEIARTVPPEMPFPAPITSSQPIARHDSIITPPAPVAGSPVTGSSGLPTRGQLPDARVVNTPTVKLGFGVAKVGPSGLGGVDVWATTDEGATWEKVKNPGPVSLPVAGDLLRGAPAKGQVSVTLPREGAVFGFILIVKSRAGLGAPDPKPGDVPQVRLELDRTAPTADLFAPQADPARAGALILSWKADDRNIAQNPVSLEWAASADGPWSFIGEQQLPNTGRHSWQIAENTPHQVYLRLTVRDQAGNASVAKTPQPIVVDLSQPVVNGVVIEK